MFAELTFQMKKFVEMVVVLRKQFSKCRFYAMFKMEQQKLHLN